MSLTPLLDAPLAIQVHAFAALAATLLGALVLFGKKGTPAHKLMGRIWAALMIVVATSAIFINEIRLIGPFSPIHLFSIFSYAMLANGIWQIRHGNVQGHRASMTSLYFGALLLAGSFTFLPGRRMHAVLFGADAGWTPSLIFLGAALGLTGFLWWLLQARRVAE